MRTMQVTSKPTIALNRINEFSDNTIFTTSQSHQKHFKQYDNQILLINQLVFYFMVNLLAYS